MSLDIKNKTEIQAKTEGKYSPIIIVSESLFWMLGIVAVSLSIVWWGMNEPWNMQATIASFSLKEKPVIEENRQEQTYRGKGETKEKAFQNAKKNAILKEVGEWISATTQVREFRVVKEEILSFAEGYISDVEIVSEKQAQGLWEVEIRCRISPYKIMNSISQNAQLQSFQRKRVVVTFNKDLEDKVQLAGIKQLASHIEEFLNNKGFKMFVEQMALSLFQEVADEFKEFVSVNTLEQIKELATDFLVCIHAEKRESKEKGNLLKVSVLARNRVGINFGSFTREYPVKSLGTVSDWEEAVNQCITEVNELFYRILVHKISQGDQFTLHFQNYGSIWHDRIEETMNSLPYKGEVVDRKKELRMEITGWDKVDYEIKQALKRANIPMEWNSLGNWFFIRKPNLGRIWGSIAISLALFVFCMAKILKRYFRKIAYK